MPSFSHGEAILVRYPFTDLSGAKARAAAGKVILMITILSCLVMITAFAKGTKLPDKDYRYDTNQYFRYRYDTVGLFFPEKGGESYLYQKGRFYPVITSD